MIDPVPHDPFEDFARARAPHLYRSAWLLCGHRAEAEDLVQETLAKVYVRMDGDGSRPHHAGHAHACL